MGVDLGFLDGVEDFVLGLGLDLDLGVGLEVSRTRFPGFFWPGMVDDGGRLMGWGWVGLGSRTLG